MRLRALLPLAVTGISLSVAACGGDSGSGEASAASDADLVVTAVDPLAWDSETYSVAAGDVVVELRNDSSLPHNLTIVDADGAETGTVLEVAGRGDTISTTTALDAGTYSLICTIPGHTNMRATLTVS